MTQWDITTATHNALDFISVASEDTAPMGIFFRSDGLKMYMVGHTNDKVYEYDLSVAWDITTATHNALDFISVASEDTAPMGIFFRSDGLKMYMVGSTNDKVYEYDLSVAWDITTATHNALDFISVASEDTAPMGIFFRSDGLKMYMVGYTNDKVYEYDLSVAWDITTATHNALDFISVASEDTAPAGIFFRSDGLKMYMVGYTNDKVHEYDLYTDYGIVFDGIELINPEPFQINPHVLMKDTILESGKHSIQSSSETALAVTIIGHTDTESDVTNLQAKLGTVGILVIDGTDYTKCHISAFPYKMWAKGEWTYTVSFKQDTT